MPERRLRLPLAALGLAAALAACGGTPTGDPVRFHVPEGAGLATVVDTLAARGLVDNPRVFGWYARLRGADRALKPGVYELRRGTGWGAVVDKLVSGETVRARVVVPEGFTLRQIAPRLAEAAEISADSALALLTAPGIADRLEVPGPTLEGYLYPATYTFPYGTRVETMAREMVRAYRRVWTPARRARADSLGLDEREVVALASIIEREARVWSERPTISAVYHNRLRIGMRLQADPTVQYALGTPRARLLYRDIDAVADDPYNTYTHAGLPPGPIGSPSRGAIEAALYPAEVDFLFFVARPDGTHVFTRTLAEHNAAKRVSARLRAEAAARE